VEENTEEEMENLKMNWTEMQKAQDSVEWWSIISGLWFLRN